MMHRTWRKPAATLVAACMAWAWSVSANAGLVTLGAPSATPGFHDMQTVWPSDFEVNEFVGVVAGTVTLSVQRIDWGDLLSLKTTLSLQNQPALQLTGNALRTFQIAAGESFTTMILAQAQGPLGFGAYQLDVSFVPSASPVPLPPAGWLMLSGLLLLVLIRRRRRTANA